MSNPWEDITIEDYENHMKLDSVMQLQSLNKMMQGQMTAYPIASMMILGVAGGNGLEYVDTNKLQKVYGVDVNKSYLQETTHRYFNLAGTLECLCVNLLEEYETLPQADMIIANLLVEYIGYDCFQCVVKQVKPQYVSCIIQINLEDSWVSESPYLHAFDRLDEVHHQMEEQKLEQTMHEIDYHLVKTIEQALPNGKKLVQMDFSNGF